MRTRAVFFGLAAMGLPFASYCAYRLAAESERLPTGKILTPLGRQTEVGSFPANMAMSPDGRFLVVTNTGFRQQLSVLSTTDGKLVSKLEFAASRRTGSECLYFGLAFGLAIDGQPSLYVSRGSEDKLDRYLLADDGKLKLDRSFQDPGPPNSPKVFAGVAVSADGKRAYVANNEAYPENAFKSALSVFDLASGSSRPLQLPAFPYSVAANPNKPALAYVACERDGVVALLDTDRGTVQTLKTGAQPTYVMTNKAGNRLYVSNAGSDTISIVDLDLGRVIRTILLRPAEVRGLPGCTPLGMALSPDESRLYVALADLNAVGVVDLQKGQALGYIPAGWYPTAVAVTQDGARLFVANAKGTVARNPNSGKVKNLGQYVENIIEGTVSMIDLPKATDALGALSQSVMANNFLGEGIEERNRLAFKNPGIKHVLYVIKENRTYDNVFGDMKPGNGDASICLFPERVTPNQHALARRFVTLDNFMCCAEVSADGWNWSTAGMGSEYTERNAPYNYSGRGRGYDFEGTTNGVAVDLDGDNDVAKPPGGYIWDACAKAGVSYRNYGFFVGNIDRLGAKSSNASKEANAPSKRALVGKTDQNYRQYDLKYADSEAWVRYASASAKQMKEYGDHHAASRFSEWKNEFDGYVRRGDLPQFIMMRLPRNHTAGTAIGEPTPTAMVADNDYAVGQIVDAVSHSPYWHSTAICIVEDDAQAGFDHVDAHRAPAQVISPFTTRSLLDSHFYNTDSMLRTMELLLGLKPMNQYDALANPLEVFALTRVNSEPLDAILPEKAIVSDINSPQAYRAADSKRLIGRYREESAPDMQLNDILWGAIKGRRR